MTHIEETAASSNRIDCNFKPFACFLCYKHFIFSCFRKVAIPLFDSKSQSLKKSVTDIFKPVKFGLSIKAYVVSDSIVEICDRE